MTIVHRLGRHGVTRETPHTLTAQALIDHAVRRYIAGTISRQATAIILAEWSHEDLSGPRTWLLFQRLAEAIVARRWHDADDLLHHLVHGTPPTPPTPPDDLCALAAATGVLREAA